MASDYQGGYPEWFTGSFSNDPTGMHLANASLAQASGSLNAGAAAAEIRAGSDMAGYASQERIAQAQMQNAILLAAKQAEAQRSLAALTIPMQGRWDVRKIGAQGAESLKQIGAQGQNAMQFGAQQLNLGGEWDLKRLAAQEAARQERFNQIIPLYNSAMGKYDDFLSSMKNGQGFQMPTLPPPPTQQGGAGGGPKITAAPVFTPQQIQQQVNSGYASADAKAQTSTQQARNSISGRGFSSQSPVMMGMANQNQNAAMSAGMDNERQTRLGAAQANQGAVLAGQQAQQAQYQANQQNQLGYAGFQSQQNIAGLNAATQLAAAQLDAQSRLASGFMGGGFLGSYLS